MLKFLWSKSKVQAILLCFSIPRHTKRKPSGGAKSCAFRYVPRRANPLSHNYGVLEPWNYASCALHCTLASRNNKVWGIPNARYSNLPFLAADSQLLLKMCYCRYFKFSFFSFFLSIVIHNNDYKFAINVNKVVNTTMSTFTVSTIFSVFGSYKMILFPLSLKVLKIIPSYCLPVQCDVLPRIDHGTLNCTNHFLFGSVCQYACSPGFVISGASDTLKCRSDGFWNNAVPKCVPGKLK